MMNSMRELFCGGDDVPNLFYLSSQICYRYLDGLGGKDDDLDFMNDLGDELKDDGADKKGKKKKSKADDGDKEDENDGDWDDDVGDDEE